MTTTMSAVRRTLLSCPFCGGTRIFTEPDERGSGGQWVTPIHVGCNDCKAEQMADTVDEAVERWNRRSAAPGVSTVEDARDAVPADVMAALDRMCTPLDTSVLKGATAEADAFCMQLIRDYILRRPAPAAGDAQDAARWRFVRHKLCLTGNGDGTCAMHAINLPASIPGWPEPGDAVAEFCDAAIDAALAAQRKGDS